MPINGKIKQILKTVENGHSEKNCQNSIERLKNQRSLWNDLEKN